MVTSGFVRSMSSTLSAGVRRALTVVLCDPDSRTEALVAPRLRIPARDWHEFGGRDPFPFGHDLIDEPLLDHEAIADLADMLDPHLVEIAGAEAPTVVADRVTSRFADEGHLSSTPGDVVRSVASGHRWISLRNIETVPEYADLVNELFEDFREQVGVTEKEIYRPEGYLFIGAAGATAPAHLDHEHNLFLQVRGTKRFTTGSLPDSDDGHGVLEGMYSGEYGHTPFPPVDPDTRELGPGDGLYVAPPTVHYVEYGEGDVAISFSLVFHDAELDRTAMAYAFNAHMRRAGRHPRPPGQSLRIDQGKALAVSGWRISKSSLSRLRRTVSRAST
jgi:hypothetical protein